MKKMKRKYPVWSILYLILLNTQCEKDHSIPYNPLNGKSTAVFNPDKHYGTVSDIDGNVYKTIKIGNQVWMAENLRTTHYLNGDSLPNVTDNIEWRNLITGAFCNYGNTNSLDTIATYGRLYNWYAVADSRNLAPKGWHIPTVIDWSILIDYLGGDTVASDRMKETGSFHWESPNESDNSSGFTALPGGSRYLDKNCEEIGFYGVFWTMSEYSETSAGFLYLFSWDSIVYGGINYKANGYSVRCIKD
jgi:uncharacterized protein (TIGR02145 family)